MILILLYISEENITIEILKIMQPHHIKKLFSTLRTGDQVKFEFELQKWRKTFELPEQNKEEKTQLDKSLKSGGNHQLSVYNILSSTKSGKEIIKTPHITNQPHYQLFGP